MTAQQLSDDLTAARIAEFGEQSDESGKQALSQWPTKYFNGNVSDDAPDGRKEPRMPSFCATAFGAKCMASVLFAEAGVAVTFLMGPAMGFQQTYGGGWKDTEPVPYFGLPNGNVVNAGVLLSFFNHSQPGAYCMKQVNSEISE